MELMSPLFLHESARLGSWRVAAYLEFGHVEVGTERLLSHLDVLEVAWLND